MIGSPVRHSLSPVLHNAAFAAAGLDWVYVAHEVMPGSGAAAVMAMRTLGIGGLSVTMPHKQDVAKAVDRPSASVQALGACNCVYWSDGELVGDNTDGDGYVNSFAIATGSSVAGRTVSVLGAGGAATAIIEALGRAGAAEIHVWARRSESAQAAASVSAVASVGPIDQVEASSLIINATPVGMRKGPNPQGIPLPADLIRKDHIVHDIVYEPRKTPLMLAAGQRGATVIGGVGMLVHQAAQQFTHWTGEPAPLDVMSQAITRRK
ncbi:MAG: shikimate dehydrogenase [Acidimicrobiales bacterium]|nr:shikimate dehydrogenase [Acidimicrobiales bacterium]